MANGKRISRAYRGTSATSHTSVGRLTEGIINAKLGEILREKHPRWFNRIETESTGIFKENASLCPDIVVRHPGGTPVIIETKFGGVSAKVGKQVEAVERDAIARLALTVGDTGERVEQAIAVRLPDELRTLGQNNLDAGINDAMLEFCVFSGLPVSCSRWPSQGWIAGSIDDLANCIELAALSEDRIARGMTILEEGVGQAAVLLREACDEAPDMLEWIAERLHQKAGEQTLRMAMAIIANALTFQISIAGAHSIPTIDDLRLTGRRVSKSRVLDVWWHILNNINYWPIFNIASYILSPIRDATAQRILYRLSDVASELAGLGATSQQDLCGRMFQRLITDRKFLATFYTLPSSSTLLAELAMDRLDIDWADGHAITSLRIGDFACGTGALLSAAYGSVLSRHRRTGGDDRVIHSRMMEDAVVGVDIMPVATHLTATLLSSAHPDVPFQHTSIITLPYGEPLVEASKSLALGSLDLIEKEDTVALFDLGQERIKGGIEEHSESVELKHRTFDLVIMNPPFTRPTNHESTSIPVPSFAGFTTSEDEQKSMSERLSRIRKPNMAGHGNAGLASNFIDIADAKVKEGGVVALVLPSSFLQGASWHNARSLIESRYCDITAVSIASAGSTDRAFSADTGMAEVLVLATRGNPRKQRGSTLYINLYRRPRTILEAVSIASAVARIPKSRNSGKIWFGSKERAGCFIRGQLSQAGGAGVRDEEVASAASSIVKGQLRMAQQQGVAEIPIVNLGALGKRGLLHRDLSGENYTEDGVPRGPFDIVEIVPGEVPAYPALWSHKAERETQLIVEPDSRGIPREGSRDRADRAWTSTRSRLHFSLGFQLSSQPLAACITPEPTIGGSAWPNFQCDNPEWEEALTLWANTTLGLIAFWWIGSRQQQGRAVITITRLPTLSVLDARKLSKAQLNAAKLMFSEFSKMKLLPANEAWRDDTRQELDRAVLVELLQLPEDLLEPLALLRRQWCAEPSVHGGKGTGPPT